MCKFFISIFILLLSITVSAQNQPPIKPSHFKAAEDFLLAMGMKQSSIEITERMLDMQLKANPALAPKKDQLMKFFNKYLSWNALSKEYVTAYAKEFSEKELKELTAFYNSPIGKKLATKQVYLGLKMSALMRDKMKLYQAELLKVFKDGQ